MDNGTAMPFLAQFGNHYNNEVVQIGDYDEKSQILIAGPRRGPTFCPTHSRVGPKGEVGIDDERPCD